jgi:hypothetical protein
MWNQSMFDLLWRKVLSPPGKYFERETYQKMRCEQGYNISKSQPGISYFDETFIHDTENWWLQLHPYFAKPDSLSHTKWHFEKNENKLFCTENNSLSYETFRVSNHQTVEEKIAKYDHNVKSRLLDQGPKTRKSGVSVISSRKSGKS